MSVFYDWALLNKTLYNKTYFLVDANLFRGEIFM
jgi:hypothetical protein